MPTVNASVAPEWMAARLGALTRAVAAGHKPSDSAAFYEIRAHAQVGLLRDPINGEPSLFLLPATLMTFASTPGDGVDRLRARIMASRALDAAIERHEAAQEPLRADAPRG